MRILAFVLAAAVLLAPVAPARAGACDECGPPALVEYEATPTVKQAIGAARKLLRAIRAKSDAKLGALMPHPSVVDLSGRGKGDCADYTFFKAEGESGRGRPACVFAVLARHAKKLEAALTSKVVYANLEKLEHKRGELRTPAREYLVPLAKHRLVYLKAGSLRVVISVTLTYTEEPVPVVDGLFVEPPAG